MTSSVCDVTSESVCAVLSVLASFCAVLETSVTSCAGVEDSASGKLVSSVSAFPVVVTASLSVPSPSVETAGAGSSVGVSNWVSGLLTSVDSMSASDGTGVSKPRESWESRPS